MVGDPRTKSSDLPNVVRQGIDPELLRAPDSTSPGGNGTPRDWNDPFKGIPLPGSRRPRLPSWFEDPSQPGLPPSLGFPPAGNSPGFPPIPAPVPEPSTIPQSQIHQWLLDYLVRNSLPEQRHHQQTAQLVRNTAAGRDVFDPGMGLVALQQVNQEYPASVSTTGPNEEASKQQARFLRSRLEYR
jgi:hypothetical protein